VNKRGKLHTKKDIFLFGTLYDEQLISLFALLRVKGHDESGEEFRFGVVANSVLCLYLLNKLSDQAVHCLKLVSS
jgi:hypothetical protein